MNDDYIERLARFAAGLQLTDIPDRVLERARLVLLDTCGAIIGGRTLREVGPFAAWAGAKGDAAMRALADGTAGVSQELDEGCAAARGHPGVHVVPATLAVGAEQHATGDAVLLAMIAGYETAARMGAATRLRDGMHPHGTWGTPGGAVAVGRLIGLDERQLAQAIRLGATLSLAPDYQAVFEGVPSRNLWAGMGNLASVVAARAAQAGYAAPRDAPGNTYGRGIGVSFDPGVAGAGLGEDWYLGRNYFKLYACCRHTHAAIDAFRAALAALPAAPADIERIDVHTYERAVAATGRPDLPHTPLAAKFSIAYTFAAWLHRGNLDDASFHPPVLGDPALVAMMGKVRVAEDPALSAMLPAKRGARVKLVLSDGRRHVAEVSGSRGDPGDALSRAEVEQKFRALADPVIGEARARTMVREITNIERAPSIAALLQAMNGTD